MAPAVVMRPIWSLPELVNHSTSSGPSVMSVGLLLVPGRTNSLVTVPAVVMRPMAPLAVLPDSVNHKAPSGPVTMFAGAAPAVMPVLNSLMVVSVGLMLPIRSTLVSVNQRLLSGPTVMPLTPAPAPEGTTADCVSEVRIRASVARVGLMLPILPVLNSVK